MDILSAIIALPVGAALGYLAAAYRSGALRTRIGVLESKITETEKTASRLAEARERAFADTLAAKERGWNIAMAEKERAHAEAAERMEAHHRDALEALQGRFDETVAKMKAELENVTADMLRRRQEEFEASSREGVSQLLQPLNANIAEMRRAVAENTVSHSEIGGRLAGSIRLVMEHSDAARKSADRLADALRGGGRIQGDWGETVLTELLESQGLTEGRHFDTQATMRDAAGNAVVSDERRRLRPDVILHLDRERDVIIDAKVSLSAWLDYMEATTDEARDRALKSHVASVEAHVAELARKDYSSYVRPPKVRMNYVIMFVPNTTALYAAMQARPGLWRKAMEKNVYIADEQTLYAALRIIDMTWRQISQAENHERVYALANEMLDRVNMFMEKFTAIGRKIDDAQRSYGEALAKLRESGQSIPVTCGKLLKLGATVQPRRGVAPDLLCLGQTADGETDG